MPAALLTMAVMINGPTKSTLSAWQTPTMIGATRMTAVALGRKAHTGATSATISSRNRLPLPPVAWRNASPNHSKIPVLPITRATTMPPKSRASGPLAVCTIGIRSLPSRDAEHDQDADPEQGGHRHIDQVERDQEDHGDEDTDGEINLKVCHWSITSRSAAHSGVRPGSRVG